ncbi:MAG: response regulator transcription factor [Casimicrobiaceae bacterium]
MISTSPQPVLIVEDDRKTSELIALHLEDGGFATVAAYSGQQALDLAAQRPPVLTILDVMLPDLDGWEVCRRLRNVSAVPILMLSALAQANERVRGLTLGADDYMVKPCSFAELVARVNAILRRANASGSSTGRAAHGLTLDRARRTVILDGRHVSLTLSEFRLLEALMADPGRVFQRDELLSCLYPNGGVVIDRVVDVHIAQLRQKIEKQPSKPRYVLTQRGIGYRFTDGEDQPADPRRAAA